MSAAATIAIRRKRFVRRFREAGATDAAHAVTLEQLSQRRSWIFDQMVEHGVFIATEGNRYFMDEHAADQFLTARKIRALVIGGVLLLVFLIIWMLGFMK